AERELVACTVNPQHHYHRGLGTCPWCVLTKQQGRDPFPSPQAVRSAAASAITAAIPAARTTGSIELPASVTLSTPARLLAPTGFDPATLVRPVLKWGGGMFAFVVAAVVVGWGAWKLTHHPQAAPPSNTTVAANVDPNKEVKELEKEQPAEPPPDG